MEELKAIFFDIDNTLYNTKILAEASRKNAVKAMIEAGLGVSEENGYRQLMSIVREYGPNYDNHYDRLVEKYSGKNSPRIVAAGMVAYHSTKIGYLVPYPDTIPVLLELKQRGYTLGVITNGIPTKQWEKLIRLGLQHFFDIVVISSKTIKKPDIRIFNKALRQAQCKPAEAMIVGDSLKEDIAGGNKANMATVQLIKGDSRIPISKTEEPDYIISNMSGLLRLVK